MIVCAQCGSSNEEHYKFCLACGAELGAEAAGRVADRPSTPSALPKEKKVKIPGLKERLQALRSGRERTFI